MQLPDESRRNFGGAAIVPSTILVRLYRLKIGANRALQVRWFVVVGLIGTRDPIFWIVIDEIVKDVEDLGEEFIRAR